ncbi:TetR/AcrR family transcriptional regulator [Sphingobacterium daejeonense]|uniref:TetR/AcrR family transcriptional regulator n=1 Tax=Sphingobacterium daejeonense TaxID=371142 RepID=UPI0010C56219|nr:TetR/AcrR family transcriptional regulator [Sphingobacterium daejeonense]VTQ02755.1 Rut operon repressor [Sphingobacterium daejeonense]
MENRKDQIIDAALKRFSQFGFHKTTMNEIADDLRITKANLYYYYPDKSTLIVDVLIKLANDVYAGEKEIVENYSGDLMKTMYEILEYRSEYTRKYYVLHICENLDWIKGLDINEVMQDFYKRDVSLMKVLYQKSVDRGELMMDDIESCACTIVEIQKGLGIIHTISDVITGIPNESNVDMILESQKRALKLIFEARIASNK